MLSTHYYIRVDEIVSEHIHMNVDPKCMYALVLVPVYECTFFKVTIK